MQRRGTTTMTGAAAASLLLSAQACLRSTSDIPPPIEGGALSGTVIERDLDSGLFVAVPGARVAVVGGSYSTLSDASGFFQLQGLPLDVLSLDVERGARNGRPRAARRVRGVRIGSDGQSVGLGTIELTGAADVSGRVDLSDTSSAGAAEGSLVVASETAFRAVVGREGRFLLARLPEGVFDLAALRPEYTPARAAPIAVAPLGPPRDVGTLLLARSAGGPVSARGQAVLVGAASSEGIRVQFFDETDPDHVLPPANTDAAGGYAVQAMAPGVYRARFSKEGYRTAELRGVVLVGDGRAVGLLKAYLAPGQDGDADGDGITDAQDDDGDNDGCPDLEDRFPQDALQCLDTDGDGLGDGIDPDSDGDGVSDEEENSPGIDGVITDPLRGDTDGDGFPDSADLCPLIATQVNEAAPCTPAGPGPGPVDPPPQIQHVTPLEGGPGTRVRIQGRDFPALGLAVRFGPEGTSGFVTSYLLRNRAELVVQVPRDALSGPLTVFGPFSAASSTVSFTVRHPPEIAALAPGAARHAASFAVLGHGFNRPGLLARVSGLPATIVGPPDTVATPGEILERILVVVPPGASTGPVRVENVDGAATSSTSLLVLGDPRIDALLPVRAAIGATLDIQGAGFSTADTGGVVKVRFTGAAGDVDPLPGTLRDTFLQVVVPAGAQNGPVTVVHPSGLASSTVSLVVDPLVPFIAGLATMVSPGETFSVTGGNLEGATGVSIGGVAASFAQAPQTNLLRVTAPASGALPGPLELTFAAGPPLTSRESIRIFRRTAQSPLATVRRHTFRGADGRVYALDAFGAASAHDATTLAPIAGSQVQIALPPGDTTVGRYWSSPGGDVLLVQTNQLLRTYVVEVPSFAVRGSCDDGPDRHPPSFDELSAHAYAADPLDLPFGEEGILRINLADGSCDYLLRAPAGNSELFSGAISLSQHELLVLHSARGNGRIYVDPGDPLDQTYLEPLHPPDTPAGILTGMFLGPGRQRAFVQVSQTLFSFGLGSTDPMTLHGAAANDTTQSTDPRWLLTSSSNPLDVWELGQGALRVHSEPVSQVVSHSVAGNVIFTIAQNGQSLERWEIFE